MEYIIENEYLKVIVDTFGAQLKSVVRKEDGVEHIHQADPEGWAYSAPILFPFTGELKEGKAEIKGEIKEIKRRHGFARDYEHKCIEYSENSLVLELTENPETIDLFPWKFKLTSRFVLENDTLHHILEVTNTDKEDFAFGIGYHPAFKIPFDKSHNIADYELRFGRKETPKVLVANGEGLMTGEEYYPFNDIIKIQLENGMFDSGSLTMTNIISETLGVYERDTGRGVVCSIKGFPYCLIWSSPGDLKFICIEPWHSLPDSESSNQKWEEKSHAATLNQGECFRTALSMSFIRDYK